MKKCISLITLIITIVVVIILAAAVIVSLAGNNPINNARIANLISTKDSMESGVLAYTAKIKAKTLGVVDTYETITGTNTEDSYRIIEKDDEGLVTCEVTKDEQVITLYKIDKDLFKQNVDKLPSTPNNKCEWYLDEDGHVFLVFEENGLAPKWMTNKQKVIDDATLLTFVVYKGGEIGEGVNSGKADTPKEPEWYDKVQEADADWFTYSNNSDGTVTITGFSSAYPGTPTDIKFPTKNKEGKTITAIGEAAFNGKQITSLVFPSGINVLNVRAFTNCEKLEKIKFSSTLSNICTDSSYSRQTFYGCANITEIVITQTQANMSMTSVLPYSYNKVNKVTFEGEITSFGKSMLNSFSALESITIPQTVTTIGEASLRSTGLREINIPAKVTSIGDYAFYDCKNLAKITFAKNGKSSLESIGESAFCNVPITELNFPEGLQTLAMRAFANCTSIQKIKFPSSLVSINADSSYSRQTFYGCSNITEIVITQTQANMVMSSVLPHSYNKVNKVTFEGEITSFGKSMLSSFSEIKSITIPQTVTTIGEASLRSTGLREISIPAKVTSIGNYAFYDCKSLEKVNFAPNGESLLEYIGDSAFHAVAITELNFPEGLKILDKRAFANCTNLQKVNFSSSLVNINTDSSYSNQTFYGCSNITEIVLTQTQANKSMGSVFPGSYNKINNVSFEGVITSFGNGMLSNFTALVNLTIPQTVTSLGDSCLRASGLKEISIPSKVTSIGNYAFYDCKSLEKVNFAKNGESSLEYIGDSAFHGIPITEINFPEGLKTLDGRAFANCTNLQKVKFSSTLSSICTTYYYSNQTFNGCNNVKEIVMTQTQANMSMNSVFPNSYDKINKVTFEGTITSFGEGMLSSFKSLESLTIPSTVTSLGKNSLRGTGLKEITIPSSVKSIGEYTFLECTNLTTINYSGSASGRPWGAPNL